MEAGLNSPVQQALQGWYQAEVDAGFANLQDGNSSSGGSGGNPGGDGGTVIIVHCGGSLGDVSCLPPVQAVDASQPYRTNLLYPGLAPGDVPAGPMADGVFQVNGRIWRSAPDFIEAFALTSVVTGTGGYIVYDFAAGASIHRKFKISRHMTCRRNPQRSVWCSRAVVVDDVAESGARLIY